MKTVKIEIQGKTKAEVLEALESIHAQISCDYVSGMDKTGEFCGIYKFDSAGSYEVGDE